MPPPPERAAAAGVRAAFVFTPPRGAVLAQLAERVDDGAPARASSDRSSRSPMPRTHTASARAGKARGKMVLHVNAPRV
ncbi:MAG: hypothetical protein MZW92_48775 [Comamonadaceae bacterium]|nr:hypothetical protein [Comamonadaceae bacterium]